jgi:hypothetical protein
MDFFSRNADAIIIGVISNVLGSLITFAIFKIFHRPFKREKVYC